MVTFKDTSGAIENVVVCKYQILYYWFYHFNVYIFFTDKGESDGKSDTCNIEPSEACFNLLLVMVMQKYILVLVPGHLWDPSVVILKDWP